MKKKLNYLLIFITINIFSINSYAQLNGIYTIGPTAPVYKTITQAVLSLYTYGVLGPVTFNIQDGIYNEQVYIPFINNTSINNLVTFQSLSGDSSKVIIKYKPASDTMNYTLMLDGVSYLVFKKLTFTTDTVFGRVIDINNNSMVNQFINNRIIGMVDSKELVYSKDTATSIDNYNRFENNLFQYGSIGIAFSGADNTSLEQGVEITKNQFIDQSQKAIELKYSYNFKIRNNQISSSLGLNDFTGIKIQRCNDKFWVEKNKINISNKSQTCHGISVILSYGTSAANASSVSNNFIHIFSNEYVYVSGLEILGTFKNFYYNSVNFSGNNEASVGFQDITASNINIVNNIFANHAKGLAITLNDTTNIYSDYNDFFSTGTDICSEGMNYYPTLISWNAALNKDLHSISIEPLFFSNTDLHTRNFRLGKKGKTVTAVTDDIDGNTRKTPKPDIGADEFNYKLDLGPDRYICAGLSATLTSETGFDTYLWSNGNTTNTITVDSSGTGTGTKNIKLTVSYQGNFYSDSVLIHFIVAQANIGSDKSFCENELVTLDATGGIKFIWNTGDTTSSINFTATQSAFYHVTVTDKHGCIDSASVWINVKPLPATPTIILVGTDSLKSSVPGTSYTWFLNKIKLNDKTSIIKALVNGTYSLIVYDSSCHSDTSMGFDFKKNSIEYHEFEAYMSVYPNPANNFLVIDVENLDQTNSVIEIISVLGQKVFYSEHNIRKYEINLSDFPKGLYLIKLKTERKTYVERFVIQ